MLLAFAIRFISSGTESKQIVLIHEASEKQNLWAKTEIATKGVNSKIPFEWQKKVHS